MLLKGAGAGGALALAAAAGLKPVAAQAADWNKSAFNASDIAGAMKSAGVSAPVDSKDLVIKALDIAENGAVVPVEVISNIPGTQEIAVFVEKNPLPLAASFTFANGADPQIAVRLKMGQTSNIKAVARTADGKYFAATREVKVTVGGCGG
jgi:sulfur-oxidizing protein SoxY